MISFTRKTNTAVNVNIWTDRLEQTVQNAVPIRVYTVCHSSSTILNTSTDSEIDFVLRFRIILRRNYGVPEQTINTVLTIACVIQHMITYEPAHSISYNTACIPSEDCDQPAHQSSHGTMWIANDPKRLQTDSKDTDQAARKRRLIFAGRRYIFLGSAMSAECGV